MGTSHARAYHQMADDFEIVGLVARGAASRRKLNAEFGGRYAEFPDYADALARTKPDVVCISTYSETRAAYAAAALEAGAHVFLEKPVADNIADGERVIALAQRLGRKLVVGYILQVHPSWKKFTELARTLGKHEDDMRKIVVPEHQQRCGEIFETINNEIEVVSSGIKSMIELSSLVTKKLEELHGSTKE